MWFSLFSVFVCVVVVTVSALPVLPKRPLQQDLSNALQGLKDTLSQGTANEVQANKPVLPALFGPEAPLPQRGSSTNANVVLNDLSNALQGLKDTLSQGTANEVQAKKPVLPALFGPEAPLPQRGNSNNANVVPNGNDPGTANEGPAKSSVAPEASLRQRGNSNNANVVPDGNANGVPRPGNALASTITDKSAEIKGKLQAFKDMTPEERQTLRDEQAKVKKAIMQEIRQQIKGKNATQKPN